MNIILIVSIVCAAVEIQRGLAKPAEHNGKFVKAITPPIWNFVEGRGTGARGVHVVHDRSNRNVRDHADCAFGHRGVHNRDLGTHNNVYGAFVHGHGGTQGDQKVPLATDAAQQSAANKTSTF